MDMAAIARRLTMRGVTVAGESPAAPWIALFGFAADATLAAIGQAAAVLFPRYGMVGGNRIGEFVAQTAHETGGFTRFVENLDYSAQGLADTWPGRFAIDPQATPRRPNPAARAIAHQPERIAEIVYARLREGNTAPGDGWRYRGRGMIQLTFRNGYRAAGQRLGIALEAHPELAADPATSLHIALDFWAHAGVNACCDAGDFTGARGLTNAGTRTPAAPPIGLADVATRRARLMPLFG